MKGRGEWVPASAPLDEGYWRALLQSEESVAAVSAAGQADAPDIQTLAATGAPLKRAKAEGHWENAREAMERGEVLELPVVGCNRGGVLVGWNGLRGFVPASHLLNLSFSADEEERRSDLRRLVGTRLRLRIIELDAEARRFVLSERATRLDEGRRQELLEQISPGDVCQGRVTSICSFGVFVDLGGVEGLVHVSELSWGRVEHPGDLFEPGQSVDVHVLNVDRERGRVGLSIRRLQPDPWQSVEQRYQAGQIVEVTITHLVDFGAFARVEDGLEGLIHVSELTEERIRHPRDVVRKGDVVAARILNVDGERQRIGLSLRQVEGPGLSS